MVGKSKLTVIVSSLLAGMFLLTSCQVNVNGVAEAFSDLGRNLGSAVRNDNGKPDADQDETAPVETVSVETAVPEPETTEETEPDATEAEEPTATPTATPTPTSTPTPSPTPVPQRVDFSELNEDPLTGSIDALSEDFAESAHAEDDDDIILAEFTGNRLLIDSETELASVTSVNLMLDAFYMEAEGLYNRAVNEQYAAYALDPDTVPGKITVTVGYEYFFNGRLLGVISAYSVAQDDEVINEHEEYATYDLYTGQYITNDMLFSDYDAFCLAVTTEIAEESENTRDRAADYHVEFVGTETGEDGKVLVTALVYGADGSELYEVDIADVSQYLTRFGMTLWHVAAVRDIADDEETADEAASDEEDDEDEEEDEETEQTSETEEEEPEETEAQTEEED